LTLGKYFLLRTERSGLLQNGPFPSPLTEAWGILPEDLNIKLTKLSVEDDWISLMFLTLRLVRTKPLEIYIYSLGFPILAMVPMDISTYGLLMW
jgi:hypothetical protein